MHRKIHTCTATCAIVLPAHFIVGREARDGNKKREILKSLLLGSIFKETATHVRSSQATGDFQSRRTATGWPYTRCLATKLHIATYVYTCQRFMLDDPAVARQPPRNTGTSNIRTPPARTLIPAHVPSPKGKKKRTPFKFLEKRNALPGVFVRIGLVRF